MKIRLPGLPAETGQAVRNLNDAQALDVTEVSNPYPNRGDSRIVRACIEAQLPPGNGAVP